MVQITKKGKEASNKKLQLKDVESDFLNFYAEESTKSIDSNEIKSSSPQDLIDSGFSDIESLILVSVIIFFNMMKNIFRLYSTELRRESITY